VSAAPDYDIVAAARLRSLLAQMRLSRADAASLLRAIADQLDDAGADEHLVAAAEREAVALRAAGYHVGPAPRFEIATVAAAYFLQRTSGTLRNWRCFASGPPWRADRNRVVYALTDLIVWRSASRSVTITEPADVV